MQNLCLPVRCHLLCTCLYSELQRFNYYPFSSLRRSLCSRPTLPISSPFDIFCDVLPLEISCGPPFLCSELLEALAPSSTRVLLSNFSNHGQQEFLRRTTECQHRQHCFSLAVPGLIPVPRVHKPGDIHSTGSQRIAFKKFWCPLPPLPKEAPNAACHRKRTRGQPRQV